MSLFATAALLILSLLAAAIANWRERRPHPLGKAPLVSYPVIQMVAIVVAVLMAAHLVSLMTGQPLRGRLMR